MKSYPIKNTKQNIGMLDLERNLTQHSFREEDDNDNNNNIEEFDRGMPARTTFKVKKQLLNEHNNHNDFDLFDKIDTKTAKILHNETMSQDGEFADLYNEQNLITKIQ